MIFYITIEYKGVRSIWERCIIAVVSEQREMPEKHYSPADSLKQMAKASLCCDKLT